MLTHSKLLGAILLVSGTTIGAGMLAMPVTTGVAGFFPSLLLLTVIWLFMLTTAFLLLEVNLRMKGETNIISMVKKTLGRTGEVFAWILYLLLLYALTAAYIVGLSQLFGHLGSSLGLHLPEKGWPLVILLVFGFFVYLGTRVVDYFNRILMIGLGLSYILLMGVGLSYVSMDHLSYSNWPKLSLAVSTVLTSFGFHIIIPSLTTYLNHSVKQLKIAIFVGSLIPFLVYLLWQWVVMGVIPVNGPHGLESALMNGQPATSPLREFIHSSWMVRGAEWFAFFAIVTSFLGVALSLSDFIADGLKIQKKGAGKVWISLFTFIPPLLFALFYPQGFILALRYAGIIVAILLGFLPTLMAWKERYDPLKRKGLLKSEFTVFGAKPLLCISFVLSILLAIIDFVGYL